MGEDVEAGWIVRFPQSRVTPAAAAPGRVLGFGAMAATLGIPHHQTTGHWCSRCRGIEVACPVCGNRHG